MNRTFRTDTAIIVRALCCAFMFAGSCGPFVLQSRATLFTLADGNATASFQTETADNDFSWTSNGINQLNQQAFWYRTANVAEQSVHSLPIGLQGTSDTNFDGNPDTLFVRYLGDGFTIDLRYVLEAGSDTSSDIAEQITITNTTGSVKNFAFFQYSDFNLNGSAAGDSVKFTDVNAVQQTKNPPFRLTETVVTPVPTHREAALFPTTRNKLNDGVATTLSDTAIGTTVGPGDVTWAYEWDFQMPPNSSYIISKDKNLFAFVPEPASGFLLITATGLFVAAYRRRRIN